MKYFNSLDRDHKGYIGLKELEEPLIALGVADNRNQIEDMIKNVNTDASGQIGFNEFLEIVRGGKESAAISKFFKGLVDGKLIKDSKVLPFRTVVSSYRRRMIMNALMCKDPKKKEKGEKIMKAFARSISISRKSKNLDDGFFGESKAVFPKYKRIFDENTVSPLKKKIL